MAAYDQIWCDENTIIDRKNIMNYNYYREFKKLLHHCEWCFFKNVILTSENWTVDIKN